MTTTRRRLLIISLGTGLAALAVVGVLAWRLFSILPPFQATPDPTNPLAVVNGVVITAAMVDREVKVSRLNVLAPLPPLSGADLTRAREEALNQLINRQLILQAAVRDNFQLDQAAIARQVDLLFGSVGPDRLDAALAKAGVTQADLTWWVSEQATVEAYTVEVIMADAAPENRQRIYNDWLNNRQAEADIRSLSAESSQTFTALPGHPAPNFTLSTPTGERISLSDYQGQVVLVNFWASWCPSCLAELPDYQAVYRQYGAGQQDFAILAVNLQETGPYAQQFADGLQLTFPILLDQTGDVTIRDYQMVGMPGSIIVDAEGVIFYRHLGPMSGQLLREKLAALDLSPTE